MTHTTIAVIGHVDHGKTALVKALTGMETDTLKEEQTRGLTIALGFAVRRGTGARLHFVDTPGHADFVRTTASGLSGADTALLVISARDGIQAQTVEHLKLAQCFAVPRLVIALSQSDLANQDTLDARSTAIADLLVTYGFSDAPIVPYSAITQDGIEILASTLESLPPPHAARPAPPGAYLPIDRVFSAPGVGTIVAGTLLGEALSRDQAIRLHPTGIEAPIRGLQIAGEEVDSAKPGTRVAVNLRGVERAVVKTGHVLSSTHGFYPSDRFDVLLDEAPIDLKPFKHMEQVMVLWGTAQAAAKVRLYGSSPDQKTYVQLEFSSAQLAYAHQRFALRRPASNETVLGGTILDPAAQLVTRQKPIHIQVLSAIARADPQSIAQALANRDRGCVTLADLARVSNGSPAALQTQLSDQFVETGTDMIFRSKELTQARHDFLAALTKLHENQPIRPHHPIGKIKSALRHHPDTLIDYAIRTLRTDQTIRGNEMVCRTDHDPFDCMSDKDRAAVSAFEQNLEQLGLSPEANASSREASPEMDDIIELLISTDRAVLLFNHALDQSVLLHTNSIQLARDGLRTSFKTTDGFTTGEARAALKTNRKTIVPLLEYFDQTGATQRTGNVRVLIEP